MNRRSLLAILPAGAFGSACRIHLAAKSSPSRVVATFSIVARDAQTGELGIAVQSRFLGVGSVVPWAKAKVGAIATQSFANTTFGPKGLAMLEAGKSPGEVMEAFKSDDGEMAVRQVGIVDAQGRAASFTGDKCLPWCGGRTGKGYAVQGNILAGEAVVEGMAKAFEATEGDLAGRLVSALEAGQAAGGDKRGMQSAALLIVREGWGYGGFNDRFRDLRVDDHSEPIAELRRLLVLHRKVWPRPAVK